MVHAWRVLGDTVSRQSLRIRPVPVSERQDHWDMARLRA
jgi:hypothetical protein